MIRKILKSLNLVRKQVSENIDKSTDFIDKTLDQEYISGGIDKAKELSGKLAEKAGETYENLKESAQETLNTPELTNVSEKLTKYGNDLKAKGQSLADKALENEIVRDTVEEIKDSAKNLSKTIEDKIDSIKSSLDIDEEE